MFYISYFKGDSLSLLPAKRISSPIRPQASIAPSLHSKNTPVPPRRREQDVPIFHRFKLSICNCKSPIHPSLHRSLLSPSRLFCFFFFLSFLCFFCIDMAAGCIESSQCLASLRLQTFFGNYKQPSQPREAFVDSFADCINIYQALKHRQTSTMRRFLRVAWW